MNCAELLREISPLFFEPAQEVWQSSPANYSIKNKQAPQYHPHTQPVVGTLPRDINTNNMNMSRTSSQPQKDLYVYKAPWTIFGTAWSERKDQPFRLALGSFIEEYANKVSIVQLNEQSNEFKHVTTFEHPYPTTKIQWYPSSATTASDLLVTSGDYLRLYQVQETSVVKQSVFNNNTNSEYCAPLTSFDWNRSEPSIIGTSSIDTTCTIWDVTTARTITQLIAHDKEVYDIAFAKNKDVFASVGADGSMRMFDLRNLEHSTILYETPDNSPLLRLSWNKKDPNYLATFAMDSKVVTILDIRVPSLPVAQLKSHTDSINSMAWAPHSSCHIITASDDCRAMVWDLSNIPQNIDEPILAYNAKGEINQVQWSMEQMDWVALTHNSTLEVLRV